MMWLRRIVWGTGMIALLAQAEVVRAEEGAIPTPDLKEICELIRSHLAGASEAELNRDAVQGLLSQLHGKVSLVESKNGAAAPSAGPPLNKSAVYDGSIAYFRVGTVTEGLAGQIAAAYEDLSASNGVKGAVLDLRFADGQDYSEAVAVADLFIAKERPLLDWGNGLVQSKDNPGALTVPVAILVNAKTAAAAEALAALLREDDRAILLGANTAGEATMSQDFPLKNGQYLRIATAAIKLGDGQTLTAKGVTPDIQVNVKAEDERAYYADPYKEIASASRVLASITGESLTNNLTTTNRVLHARIFNEAELMRERKEKPGVDVEDLPIPAPSNDSPMEKPVIRDPVLGRALDLIKGIAAMNHTH